MASPKTIPEYWYIAENSNARYVVDRFDDAVRLAQFESTYWKRECKVLRVELKKCHSNDTRDSNNLVSGIEHCIFYFDKQGVPFGIDT